MVEIRPATPADCHAMADVINPIIAAGGTTAFETQMAASDIAALTLDRPELISVFVAFDATGTIGGFQYLMDHPGLGPGIADIASFATLKGAGRALMAQTIAAARAAGMHKINAKIRADNGPGLGFYAAMGFVDHSVEPAVPLSDGTPVDRVIKRLKL